MSGSDKAESRSPKASQRPAPGNAKTRKPRGTASADLGQALRSVYDKSVREEVPDDFRDLLDKLK